MQLVESKYGPPPSLPIQILSKFGETALDTAWHTTDVETAGYLNDGLAEVEPYCNTGTYFNKYISYFCLLYTC